MQALAMKKAHTYRVKPERWKAVEDKAVELTLEEGRIVKPTDILDAILFKGIKGIQVKDLEKAKKKPV